MNRWFVFGLCTPFALALLAGVLVVALCWPTPRHPVHVRAPTNYPVHGIDVSHHQGAIDWSQVAASGRVHFAWIKATEGAGHTDRRFHENWKSARATGLAVGAYHYYSMCRTGASQAAHFIETVPREVDALPPAVDVESDPRCNRVPPADLAEQLGDYLDRVEAHYGVRPIVYATPWYRAELFPDVSARAWSAAYTREPSSPWLFWQYTSRGRVAGIRWPVDRNVFRGDLSQLWALAGVRLDRSARSPRDELGARQQDEAVRVIAHHQLELGRALRNGLLLDGPALGTILQAVQPHGLLEAKPVPDAQAHGERTVFLGWPLHAGALNAHLPKSAI